jgi:hypothetical protein
MEYKYRKDIISGTGAVVGILVAVAIVATLI